MRSWRLELGWDRPPLSLNDRMHWAPASKIAGELRETAGWLCRSHHIPPLERVRVTLEWVVPDRRNRDVDNPVKTLKPICDGIVDAGVVPDDIPKYMEKPPVEIIYRKGERSLSVHIEELGAFTPE